MRDVIDNNMGISSHVPPVDPKLLKFGSLKGKVEVHMCDRNNTILYIAPHKDVEQVKEEWRKRLGLS
jgi:hypothetical protein